MGIHLLTSKLMGSDLVKSTQSQRAIGTLVKSAEWEPGLYAKFAPTRVTTAAHAPTCLFWALGPNRRISNLGIHAPHFSVFLHHPKAPVSHIGDVLGQPSLRMCKLNWPTNGETVTYIGSGKINSFSANVISRCVCAVDYCLGHLQSKPTSQELITPNRALRSLRAPHSSVPTHTNLSTRSEEPACQFVHQALV